MNEVIAVGGSTLIPRCRELLRGYFGGKELCVGVDPYTVVTQGAAIQAAILEGAHTN